MNPLSLTASQPRSLTHPSMINTVLNKIVGWLPVHDVLRVSQADKRMNTLLSSDNFKVILDSFREMRAHQRMSPLARLTATTLKSKSTRVKVEGEISDHACHILAKEKFSAIYSHFDRLCMIHQVGTENSKLLEDVVRLGSIDNHAFIWSNKNNVLIPIDLQTGNECQPVRLRVDDGLKVRNPVTNMHLQHTSLAAFSTINHFFLLKKGTLCVVTLKGDVCYYRISPAELTLIGHRSLSQPNLPVQVVESVQPQEISDSELRLFINFSLDKAPAYVGAPKPRACKIVYCREGIMTVENFGFRSYNDNSPEKIAPETAFCEVGYDLSEKQLKLTASSIDGQCVIDHWKQDLEPLPLKNGKFQEERLEVTTRVNTLFVVVATSYFGSRVRLEIFDKKTGSKYFTIKGFNPSTTNSVWLQSNIVAIAVGKTIVCWELSKAGAIKFQATEADTKEREGRVTDVCMVSPTDIRVLLQLNPISVDEEEGDQGDDLYLVHYTSSEPSTSEARPKMESKKAEKTA